MPHNFIIIKHSVVMMHGNPCDFAAPISCGFPLYLHLSGALMLQAKFVTLHNPYDMEMHHVQPQVFR